MLEHNENLGSSSVAKKLSHRQEAVAAGIGGCLLFLEDSVEQHKTAPLGTTKFEKGDDQLNKV